MAESNPTKHAHNFKDITGQRFGKLVAQYFVGTTGTKQRSCWKCICDCGDFCITKLDYLIAGKKKHCGASIHHVYKGIAPRRVYRVWLQMHSRCKNKHNSGYRIYGNRGITVCERWNSFKTFIADMGIPACGLSIDRIDGRGNYEPSNCRWANILEQARNKSNNVWIEFNGRKQLLHEWAKEYNILPLTLRRRIKAGWPLDRAFSLPVKPSNQHTCGK